MPRSWHYTVTRPQRSGYHEGHEGHEGRRLGHESLDGISEHLYVEVDQQAHLDLGELQVRDQLQRRGASRWHQEARVLAFLLRVLRALRGSLI